MREFAKAADLERKAAKVAEEEQYDPVEFKVRDRLITIDYPGSGQIMYLSMILASDEDDLRRTGGLINFLVNLMDDDDRRFIRNLLLDKHSGFDGEDIEEIVKYVVEEWSGHPTEPPADSTPSRSSGGPKSTGASRRATQTRPRSTSRV